MEQAQATETKNEQPTVESILDEIPPGTEVVEIPPPTDDTLQATVEHVANHPPFTGEVEPAAVVEEVVEPPESSPPADEPNPMEGYALEEDVAEAFAAVKETTDGLQSVLNEIKKTAGTQHDVVLKAKINEWEGRLNKLVAESKRQTEKLQKCLSLADSEINRWKKIAEAPHKDGEARESIEELRRQIKSVHERVEKLTPRPNSDHRPDHRSKK